MKNILNIQGVAKVCLHIFIIIRQKLINIKKFG